MRQERNTSTHRGRITRSGMTLVEVMVVVVIIVILVAVLIPAVSSIARTGKIQVARATLAQIEQGLEAYQQSWEKLLAGGGWITSLSLGLPSPPMKVPALPPLYLADNSPDAMPVWDGYDIVANPMTVRSFGSYPSYLWGAPATVPTQPAYEANQCLGWALTADVGGGPYLTETSPDTIRMGLYEHPELSLLPPASDPRGDPTYPLPSGAGIARPKVTLVDPWDQPYLYGWEIEVRDPTGTPQAAFRKAWIASAGPDGEASLIKTATNPTPDATWIRDAKYAQGGDAALQAQMNPINLDNVLP